MMENKKLIAVCYKQLGSVGVREIARTNRRQNMLLKVFFFIAVLTVGAVAAKNECKISYVESIPLGMVYPNDSIVYRSTYDTWSDLIATAKNTIEIASFYWTMKGEDVLKHESAKQGEIILDDLVKAGRDRGIKLKIVQSIPTSNFPDNNTRYLEKEAGAEVRSLNLTKLIGGGILHTKFLLIDRVHFYVGSANMDWRALTQVKELGIVGYNCTDMAKDLAKIFDVYWLVGESGKIPVYWPKSVKTKINIMKPMNLTLNGNRYKSFISSSPPRLSPPGRTNDLDALINIIEKAEKFIYISVMDFIPLMVYGPTKTFWPLIDNALRKAAIDKKVNVRLLVSRWKSSHKSVDYFLKSLEDLNNCLDNVQIEVRRFVVPDRYGIPFTRVNHNKYMVTDKTAYISTNNWSGDYFVNTAGISVVFEDDNSGNKNSLRQQLETIFERDWFSEFAFPKNSSSNQSAREL